MTSKQQKIAKPSYIKTIKSYERCRNFIRNITIYSYRSRQEYAEIGINERTYDDYKRILLDCIKQGFIEESFNGKEKPLTLADDPARVSYLQELGWQVESTPVETLDLQLPQELAETWGEYAAMQTAQGMPFADYAGQPVRRYTYRVTNYPGMEKGVQANLYLCGDVLIGGDIVATGKGGFQHGLEYPGV